MITSICRSQRSTIGKVSFCSLMFLLGLMLSQWDTIFWSLTLPRIWNVYLNFKYRLSRARQIIENTFRILAARFRIFRRSILSCLETVENITKACVALHNYLMAIKNFGEANSYYPNGCIEQDVRRNGEWRETVKDDYWLIPQSRDYFDCARYILWLLLDIVVKHGISENEQIAQ